MNERNGHMTLDEAFRELRGRWFQLHLTSRPHERVWEEEHETAYREAQNKAMRVMFDADTDAILRGEDRPVAPLRWSDIDKAQRDREDREALLAAMSRAGI